MVGQVAFDLLILFLVTTRAALVNVTIDDTDGDSVTHQLPVYQPASPWGGPSCEGCDIIPDPSLAFDGTWHAATYHPELLNVNITFSFTGVSIWVFFILANANKLGTGITSNTECNFTLDGQLAGYFNHQPNESTNSLQYNSLAFSADSLSNSRHDLVISINDLPYSAYVNFDYAIYAVDVLDSASSTASTTATSSTTGSAGSPSLSSATKLGIIVGCVVGGLLFIVLGMVLVLFRRLRKTEKPPIQQLINALHRERPRSYPDNRTMSGDSLPWQSSIYTDRPGQGLASAGEGTFNDQQSHIRSPSSDLTSEVTSFAAPVRREYQPLHVHSTKSLDELRVVRQMEINQRLQNAQREMYNLTLRQSVQGGHGSTTSDFGRSETEDEMVTMREQIRQLKTQIEQLQAERSSDWAQGLSNDPPPAYI